MGAGDGAAEQARLAAERVQRLRRQLDQAERDARSWDAGAAGERLVAHRLRQLISHGWFLLNDVHWPGRPKANLDHVLVGPGGVVVVDAKNWSSEVSVSAGVLWQGRFARTQSVDSALAQCAAVASVLAPPHRRFVRPLICLAGQPDLFGITNSDVAVAGVDRVVGAVLALPVVLDQQTVVGLYAHLGQQLTQEPAPERPSVRGVPVSRVPGRGVPVTGGPVAPRSVQPGCVSRSTRPLAATPMGQHPAAQSRQFVHSTVRGTTGAGHGRGRASKARQHAASGLARLLFLTAFAVFAVYVLPYWAR